RVAYVLTDQDDEWNIQEPRPTGHVVVQTIGDHPGAPRPLTSGAVHSSFPAWSPDGHRLAFVREDSAGGRIVIWDAERNETRPVGDAFTARAYLAPQWQPSAPALIGAGPQPGRPAQPYRVRALKNPDARIPGDQFFVDDRRALLTAIDAAGGKATPLVREPIVLRSFRVSPTGRDL